MLAKIGAAFDHTINFMAYLSCAFAAFIALSVTADVLLRFLFNRPIFWVIEISEYIIVTIAYLAAAWVLKKEAHVSLDIGINLFQPRRRALINAITSSVGAVACVIITVFGITSAWDQHQLGVFMTEKGLELPIAPFLVIIPAGFSLFSIQFLRRAYKYLMMSRGALEIKEPASELNEM